MKKIYYACMLILLIVAGGCRKMVEVSSPVTGADAAQVYSTDATATAVLTNLYASMATSNGGTNGNTGLSLYAGLSADELTAYASISSTLLLQLYNNELTNQTSPLWTGFYSRIFTTNAAIEGLQASTGVSDRARNVLTGEAKFMRAFFHLYLTGFYGDVPLVTTTDYRVNAVIARTPQADVYAQIIKDLTDAKNLLPANYVGLDLATVTSERVRPNKWAAAALLARVYLYTGNYSAAEAQATDVISQTSLYGLTTLDNAFLKNTTEAIWQLQPVFSVGGNSPDGGIFVLSAAPSSGNPVTLSDQIVNAFEPGDNRRTKWVGAITVGTTTYNFPRKYKVGPTTSSTPVTEYQMQLRFAEQYLIRAEARAWLGNFDGAKADLNQIRTRAGLGNTTATDKTTLLAAVAQERKVELFCEQGHRWFDLKRTGQVNAVLSALKPATWQNTDALYPVPIADIQKNPNLTQNSGY